jgi:RimJ/RimL family protein N-acetyltransferase
MSEQKFLFYAKVGSSGSSDPLPEGYRWTLWRPSSGGITPAGLSLIPFGVWWILHALHVFRNRDYGLFLIYHVGTLVHRSVITPGYFRFPFMERDDLQVGDTWTSGDHRGKGLATFALRQITASDYQASRRYWYVVDEDNTPSIRVVEKAGFQRLARGARHTRLGIRLLGTYAIEERLA